MLGARQSRKDRERKHAVNQYGHMEGNVRQEAKAVQDGNLNLKALSLISSSYAENGKEFSIFLYSYRL